MEDQEKRNRIVRSALTLRHYVIEIISEDTLCVLAVFWMRAEAEKYLEEKRKTWRTIQLEIVSF